MPNLTRRNLLTAGIAVAAVPTAFALGGGRFGASAKAAAAERFQVNYTPEQWRQRLKPAAFAVLREDATEPPYTSPLNDEHRAGTFGCAGCALPLFASSTKFDSHTGWPSFYRPQPQAVATRTDTTLGIPRTEVHCRRCGGHLGHVFDDGPMPTGLRYCMNGVAMAFTPATKA